MRIAVTGAYGQLGGELCRQLGAAAIPLDIDTLDLTDGPAVIERMLALRPEAIVNCAAYTQVDKAESEPERCRAVNAVAVEYLAQACGRLDCPLVQISTDYVFGAALPAVAAAVARGRPAVAARRLCANEAGRRAGRRAASEALDRPHLRTLRPALGLSRGELCSDHAAAWRHAARAAHRGRPALHADLRPASRPGDRVSCWRGRRPTGPVGNIPRDKHRPDDVV